MKKKFFGFISVLMMATMLVAGCNNAEPVTYPEPETESVATVDNTQPEITEPDVVEPAPVAEEPTETPEDTNGDPNLACLEVSEEFAKQNKCLCVYRKGHLYSLGPYVPYENAAQYYVAQVVDSSRASLLFDVTSIEERLTVNDAPFVYLTEGDELRDYNGTYMGFGCMEFLGYTLAMWETPNEYIWMAPYVNQEPMRLESWNIQQLEIHDENGNLVEDRIGIKQGTKYTVSWYTGAQYNEQELWSDTQCYKYTGSDVSVSNELTKDGYAIVHWQEINEPGIYMPYGFSGGPLATLPFRIN